MQLETLKQHSPDLVTQVLKDVDDVLANVNDPDIMKKTLSIMPKPNLRTLTSNVNATNNERDRLKNLYRCAFIDTTDKVSRLSNISTVCDQALKSAACLAFMAAYMNENSTVSWEAYKTDLLNFVSKEEPPKKKEDVCTIA